jgi:hypothetical protein
MTSNKSSTHLKITVVLSQPLHYSSVVDQLKLTVGQKRQKSEFHFLDIIKKTLVHFQTLTV